MNREKYLHWAQELKSGKYTQCRTKLHAYGSYCCIGVLGVINGVFDEKVTPITSRVAMRCGLENSQHFVRLNDRLGLSFKEIATYIEENIDKLAKE